MTVEKNARELYNNQANDWSRTDPVLLSDYSARPFVLDLCEPLQGLSVLDMGCGEGYVDREMAERGAENIFGIDISEKMIERAITEKDRKGIASVKYQVRDVGDFDTTSHNNYGLVIAVFLFNYLNISEMITAMNKAFEALKQGGHFVFSVPHPLLAFIKKDKYPFYFAMKGGYFSGRNVLFPGKIWRRDGVSLNVQCMHKTVEDYFHCLKDSGFNLIPEVHELRVTEEHLQLDPEFFEPLRDLPLHIVFKAEKP
jgi:2-polyprenyl-3-methyl-5-hydroxy-6-metoxy-1,4-benzoquinol methylase